MPGTVLSAFTQIISLTVGNNQSIKGEKMKIQRVQVTYLKLSKQKLMGLGFEPTSGPKAWKFLPFTHTGSPNEHGAIISILWPQSPSSLELWKIFWEFSLRWTSKYSLFCLRIFPISCSFVYSAWRPTSGNEISLHLQHLFSSIALRQQPSCHTQLHSPGQVPLVSSEGVPARLSPSSAALPPHLPVLKSLGPGDASEAGPRYALEP